MEQLSGESYKYEVISYLGEGGSGRVYKAFRISLSGKSKEVVALKFLKTEKDIQELVEEYKAIQNLRSPDIVKVYGIERINGSPTLVMEYIEGVTLQRLFFETLTNSEKSYLFSQMQSALHLLGQQISYHGDLSPNNIMIDGSGKLRLIDFGNHFAENHFVYGTPGFTADEVYKNTKPCVEADFNVLAKIKVHFQIEELVFDPNQEKMSVAKKVQDLLTQHTKVISPEDSHTAPPFLFLVATFFAWFLLLIPTEAKPPLLGKNVKQVEVSIVSTTWKLIRINGKSYGYTPVKVRMNTDQLEIEWESQNDFGRISKQLTAKAIHISDEDFVVTNALQK